MKKQVLFIHSAGAQGRHQGSSDMVTYLQDTLGAEYEVLYPKMPEPESPEYRLWKIQLKKELAGLDGKVILVGHSLGGSVLLKYLSEETCEKFIPGLFIIAAPYWGKKDWEIDDFVLREGFPSKLSKIRRIFLYHSRDDKWVPFAHLVHYVAKLPKATARALDGDEHSFNDGLPELVDDIKCL